MDGIPKNSKRRSQVWKHFQIKDTEKASCNSCGVQLHFRGSTFNLKRHLENKHKEIDVSQMLKSNKPKHDDKSIKFEKYDSDDSFFWAEEKNKSEIGEPIENTHDIVLETSNHSTANDAIDSKDEIRVVSFDFQDFKNDCDNLNINENNKTSKNFNLQIERVTLPPKKKIKRTPREFIEENEFRETQIFGDFVASQLRILSKKRREKLQIVIQKAILDVICEDPFIQTAP
ncbi:uncharacterized protein LOC129615431 [Condylostylus longicornis]|uniref:uncharacterized protein LOC129615431 n=1 Tax=Condylostylus longicornis TaxID=2530218 RepID=UPI00244E0951|nr:uncharacterized protein LOC129615431 [Condylostylus longicornis]